MPKKIFKTTRKEDFTVSPSGYAFFVTSIRNKKCSNLGRKCSRKKEEISPLSPISERKLGLVERTSFVREYRKLKLLMMNIVTPLAYIVDVHV